MLTFRGQGDEQEPAKTRAAVRQEENKGREGFWKPNEQHIKEGRVIKCIKCCAQVKLMKTENCPLDLAT